MALLGDHLYVADTENHLLREVDLKAHQVRTLAGTGAQAREFNRGGVGREVALNSPWDLAWVNGSLFIAMAGPHQIWRMELSSGQLSPHAGSGREGLEDGPLGEAALAQPSGITTDGKLLYVADSEVSAIRTVDLHPAGRVRTLVGLDLFEFGDRDGEGDEVRLQHPLGVHFLDGRLYVADTYNHKVKVIDPSLRACQGLFGNGRPGHEDGRTATFYEPGGISSAGGYLSIADTNNHAIRMANLVSGQVSTLALSGL
jgi:DNA-binding beta-propeller fold protein YncE